MQKGGLLIGKENRINGWWINENPYIESYARSIEKAKEEKREFRVYYCKCCSKSWQTAFSGSARSGLEILYYIDFPTYKLKRKRCPKC